MRLPMGETETEGQHRARQVRALQGLCGRRVEGQIHRFSDCSVARFRSINGLNLAFEQESSFWH